jgi:hypothetical protein
MLDMTMVFGDGNCRYGWPHVVGELLPYRCLKIRRHACKYRDTTMKMTTNELSITVVAVIAN